MISSVRLGKKRNAARADTIDDLQSKTKAHADLAAAREKAFAKLSPHERAMVEAKFKGAFDRAQRGILDEQDNDRDRDRDDDHER